MSGQFAVNAAAGKVAKIAGGAQFGDTARFTQEGRMTKAESLKIARENANLSLLKRVDKVEVLLNVKLSQTQAAALEKAHITQVANSNGIGEFSIGELRAKARILQKEGGFTPEQTRAIMENGYAGKLGDGLKALIEKGKLTFKRLRNRDSDFTNPQEGLNAQSKITPEQMAQARSGADDIDFVDSAPSTN